MDEGKLEGVQRLYQIMRRLRAPGGCPWDREQTLQSLKPCLLEETYELLEAMESGDTALHAEELGDVLLQVVFQCAIREEEGCFDLNAVAHKLADKLERRHPHVFAQAAEISSEQVLRNWEVIKQGERRTEPERSAIDGVPTTLPALLKAQRTQAKAARVGFDWPEAAGAMAKIDEELSELKEAIAQGKRAAVVAEMGDLLFAAVNTCRFIGVDAEGALQEATAKFARRFREVERRVRTQGRKLSDCSLAEMDSIWDEIKREQ